MSRLRDVQVQQVRHKATQEHPIAAPKVYSPVGAKIAAKLTGKTYRSRDHLLAIEHENEPDTTAMAILKAVKDLEQKYNMLGSGKKWKGRHFKRPADLERYFLWVYLTGSREGEPFLRPYPEISISKPRNLPFQVVKVVRPIEKAFDKKGQHEMIEQNIPIFDATEEEMWRRVLDDFEIFDLSDLFKSMSKHYYCRDGKTPSGNLSSIVQRNFRADQRSEDGKLLRNAPLLIHSLRHHRVYALKLERGMNDDLITSLIGWRDSRMVNHYAYILRAAKSRAQMQALAAYAKGFQPTAYAARLEKNPLR